MASDQIRQMVNFILQEAHEKANEIRVKVRMHWVEGEKPCNEYIFEMIGNDAAMKCTFSSDGVLPHAMQASRDSAFMIRC